MARAVHQVSPLYATSRRGTIEHTNFPTSYSMSSQTTTVDENSDEVRSELVALLPELRAFARFLVRERAEADDLVQEALARALASLAQFQLGTNLRAWMFTILRN